MAALIGRPKGSPNKSSARVDLTCEIRGYSSIDAMIDAAEIALARFIEDTEKENTGRISPMESNACEYLKLYVKIASDIANFIHPKRKAIEHTQLDVTKDMSPEQRLTAMKHAVAMLELQVKKPDGSGTP
jgi:hypothetical protein